MELQPLDFILLGGAILLAGIGLFRGLSGELGSLAGFAAASLSGFLLIGCARACAAWLGLENCVAAYVVNFVFALVSFGSVRWIVAKFVSVLVPQPTNAFLGMLSGLFKSAVVIGLLTGVGLVPAGTYSTGFFAAHSTIVRQVAVWADANLADVDPAKPAPAEEPAQ